MSRTIPMGSIGSSASRQLANTNAIKCTRCIYLRTVTGLGTSLGVDSILPPWDTVQLVTGSFFKEVPNK